MIRKARTQKEWNKPAIAPLGKIRNVAGAQGAGSQITVKT